MDHKNLVSLRYLIDVNGYPPCEAISRYESYYIFEGSAKEFAKDVHQIPDDLSLGDDEFLRGYLTLDYEQMAYDLKAEGVCSEFTCPYTGRKYVAVCSEYELVDSDMDAEPEQRLYDAILRDDLDDLESAIAEGADPNASVVCSGWVPLDFAIGRGIEFVKRLIAAGADPTLMGSRGLQSFGLHNPYGNHGEVISYLNSLLESHNLMQCHGEAGCGDGSSRHSSI